MTDDSTKLFVKEINEKERDISDKKYAIKLVETAVLTFIGLLTAGLVTFLFKNI